MTKPSQTLGGRLPLADPATLTGAQRDLFEALNATWGPYAKAAGVQMATEDGRLIGPFNSFLLHPEVTAKLLEFQATEATHTTLPPRVREVVIIAVGAVWGAEYELYAQTNVARKAGLSDHAITTLANGGIPEDLSDHEKIAARLARELSICHRVDDVLYREPEQAFGRTGLFDIVVVMGLYQTVCTALTLFEVPAPNQCREFAHPDVHMAVFAAGDYGFSVGEGMDMLNGTKVKEAYQQVLAAGAKHNVAVVGGPILAADPDSCRQAIEAGVRVFSLGLDSVVFRSACQAMADALDKGAQGTKFTRPGKKNWDFAASQLAVQQI